MHVCSCLHRISVVTNAMKTSHSGEPIARKEWRQMLAVVNLRRLVDYVLSGRV